MSNDTGNAASDHSGPEVSGPEVSGSAHPGPEVSGFEVSDPADPALDGDSSMPRALAISTWLVVASSVFFVVILGYAVTNLSEIQVRLANELARSSAATPGGTVDPGAIDGLANAAPIFVLVAGVVLLALEYLFLWGMRAHLSRPARSFFLAATVINLVFITMGHAMFFAADSTFGSVIAFAPGVQLALSVLAMVCLLPRSVTTWLLPFDADRGEKGPATAPRRSSSAFG